ncbi:hypothetical protein [Chloracidobacterium thermophilum]
MSLDSTPDLPSMLPSAEEADRELAAARELARRYRLEFVDLTTAELDYDLIHSHPVELMTRYKFVPCAGKTDGCWRPWLIRPTSMPWMSCRPS